MINTIFNFMQLVLAVACLGAAAIGTVLFLSLPGYWLITYLTKYLEHRENKHKD